MMDQILNNRYKVISQLGEGGMGQVYLASDEATSQKVAVKVLANQLTAHPEMLERFRREAETLRQLDHPNIVKFVDAFDYEGQYVIVMEYMPGGSLHDKIKAGLLPVDRVSQITLDLCDALIRAHRLHIIHRDIKPENVLMAEDGTPKLADFGVARLSEGTRMTRSGTQVGTPYYMAPEAWEGRPLDAQADIWSLGVLMFEMLTGQVPFAGDTGPAVMNKVLTTRPPDLGKLRADVPSNLTAMIGRMLTRDKEQRYSTMREVAVDLERGQTGKPIKDGRASPLRKWSSVWLFGAAALCGGAMVMTAVYFGFRYFGPFDQDLPVIEFVELSPVTEEPLSPTDAASIPSNELTDSKGVRMVFVPAGSFIAGSDTGFDDEKPAHTVYLDDYYIDKFEVTNALYAACVEEGICNAPVRTGSFSRESYYGNPQFDDFPVVFVDWEDANTYCAWRGMSLPTEAQWEKAARGTDGREYPWGSGIDETRANFDNIVMDTTAVGGYENGQSPYGAYDMAGNVWEWVADWYSDAYYLNSPLTNPTGPLSGEYKVLRGGSWHDEEQIVRTSNRGWNQVEYFYNVDFGFRCAAGDSP